VDGPVSQASALEFITAAARKAQAHGLDCFLFDLRSAPSTKEPSHDYNIAYNHLCKLGFSPTSRVAMLVDPEDTSHQFFEVTAQNAGHPWRLFHREKDAAKWLTQQNAPATP
jgi:hypothetical protein